MALTCQSCKCSFDPINRIPRILPCGKQICTLCAEKSIQILGGLLIECECNSHYHNVDKLDDLLISQISLAYLANKQPENKELKDQIEKYKFGLESAKFDVCNHYDAMVMDLDIRAEKIIECVHNMRDLLHDEIRLHRKNTDLDIEKFENKYSFEYDRIKSKFQMLNSKFEDPNISQEVKNLESSKFLLEFNNLQRSVDEIKSKSWYFVENSSIVDKSLLGYNLNNSFDKNYYKIKDLRSLLNDVNKRIQVNLRSGFNQDKLRHYVIPISRNRFINCYYVWSSKSIYLELFDQAGNSIKLVHAAKPAIYFPIYSSNGKYFVLSYNASNFETLILLYDSELNLIKSISETLSIESIFMNDSQIVCSSTFGSKCFKVFDLELNHKESFGQQTDEQKEFYFEKTTLEAAKFGREKSIPIIFGLNKDIIFFFTKKAITFMCKKTGMILKKAEKSNENSFFLLDFQSNMIEIDTYGNSIKLYNSQVDMNANSTYDVNYDKVCIIEDQYFAFVSADKQNIVIV